MASSSPVISVVVPCRNEVAHIERCVRGILAQDLGDGDFEVIVADGLSDDGTRAVLERLRLEDDRLRVVDNPAQIVSTGLNAAIDVARGSIIARMDAHTEYAPDYLRECLVALDKTGADNVGGPWIAVGKGWVGRAVAAAFQSPFAVGGARGHDPDHTGEVDTVYLGCWRREVFDRVGLFDETLVRNQDDEFNLRLRRAGGRVWQSARVQSRYRVRDSLRTLWRQYQQYGYWKVRVIQKHRLPASVRHVVPAAFVAALGALAVAGVFWPVAALAGAALAAAYLAAVSAASVVVAAGSGWSLLPILPAVFACYHLAYGLGFLRGLVDFVVLRRGPRQTFASLTRPSPGRHAAAAR